MAPNSFTLAGTKGKAKSLMALSGLLIVFAMLLAACGGSSTGPATPGSPAKKSVLKVASQSSDFTQGGLNPYNTHADAGISLLYETLYYVNPNGGTYTPWLASAYQWNSDFSQITFTLRQNIKWNDGQPFSSDDVAFTFNALKQYPAADSAGIWSFIKNVSNPDPNTVVMTFIKPYPPELEQIAGHTYIIPKHIYATVGDPTKYIATDNKPVGTGPYVLSKFQPDLTVYNKNPSYWQPDLVKVDQVQFPEYKDNATALLALSKGDVDWGGYFSPSLNSDFVAKDPAHNKLFMDAVNLYSICVNQKDPVIGGQAGRAVRLALTTALDRTQIAQQATAGLEPAGSPTGLVLPTQKDWLDPQFASLSTTADTAKAESYLTGDGYTKGPDGIYQKNGQRLSLQLRSVVSYDDWNAAAKIVTDEAKAVGIEIKNTTVAENDYYALRVNGKYDYQMMFCGMVGGSNPYDLYNTYLNSSNIGANKVNFVAWNDAPTDKLLNQFASTNDQAAQKQAIAGLQKIFVDNQPFLPLWTGADYDEYSTKNFTGWPSVENPYADGSPNTGPDYEMVILHLQPVA